MTSPVSAVEAIEKAMEGVTPGSWEVSLSGSYMTELRAEKGRRVAATWVQGPAKSREGALNQARVNEANAAYIAACNPVAMREVLALASQAEALKREMASANAELERLRRECSDGLDALSDIDDFWEACPYPDNRKHLSPAEQISSLDCELNAAHDENARLLGLIEEAVRCLDGEPEYHEQGMGCGLEDRGITDRYEAMSHGWEQAMERVYGENIAWAKDALSSATRTLLKEEANAE